MDYDIPVTTTTDLRAFQYRVVQIGGTLATQPYTAHGVLMTHTNSGEEAQVRTFGRVPVIAGGAVTAGNRLQVTSGGFVTLAASGDHSFGIAETTVASGGIARAFVNFANMFLSTSAGV